ncbi:MAG: hypothetical protein HY225_01260 [Candidatus Vogelbacteria bacterium]|nr:hypothetical protein [Candidatus Vogelbacteria bacterium]
MKNFILIKKTMSKKILKNDKYKKARGGYSRLLQICCEKCGEEICLYQKDGPGVIKRMYIDRMIEPKVSVSNKNLECPNSHTLGVKYIYDKENRPAFRIFVAAITKKIIRTG